MELILTCKDNNVGVIHRTHGDNMSPESCCILHLGRHSQKNKELQLPVNREKKNPVAVLRRVQSSLLQALWANQGTAFST